MNKPPSQKLEAVRKKIIEACPDLLEPNFSCEIKWSYQHQIGGVRSKGGVCRFIRTKRGIIFSDSPNSIGQVLVKLDGNKNLKKLHTSRLKILGQPIGIAEVLRALNTPKNCDWMIDPSGVFWDTEDGLDPDQALKSPQWNLKNDDLNDQSEKTIDFLFNLLCQ